MENENEIFGYVFSNAALLEEALTTPSYRMTQPQAEDNQRLELLGDAVLQLLATEWLFAAYPKDKEGSLTARRQHMVSSAALCAAAAAHGICARLRRNRGAGPLDAHAKTLADAVEAILGAAYLDGGKPAAEAVFAALGLTENAAQGELDGNPKTALQHYAQALKPPRIPVYERVRTAGTCDKPVFTARVTVEGVGSAQAQGGSLRQAETAAADALLKKTK